MNKLYTLTMAVFAASILLLAGCTGPEGPAGAAGKDGKDGTNGTNGTNGLDGSAKCALCHSATNYDFLLKLTQYDLSKHNRGIVYEEESGRIACGGCHSGLGFAEAAAAGKDDPSIGATGKIDCKTCHFIHDKYDLTDLGLRISKGFQLRHTSQPIDFGTGNICGKCHQARKFTRTTPDSAKPSTTGSNYSRLGPHYGVVANVFAAKSGFNTGLYEIPGTVPYPTEDNKHADLTKVTKGCVSCHMGKDSANPAVGGHAFKMPVANLAKIKACQDCHTQTEMTNQTKAKEIAADIATIRRILITKGWIDTTQAVTEEGYIVLGEYFATPGGKVQVFQNKLDVDAVLNYFYVAKDRSNGIHNPKYIYAIVKNTLEYLNK